MKSCCKLKIGIMGYYPPPIGGISVHVKRFSDRLKDNQIDYTVYSIGQTAVHSKNVIIYENRRKWALKYLLSKKEDIIHCHTMGWKEKLFYLLAGKLSGKKVMYTFHSYRDHYKTLNFKQRLAYRLVRKFGDFFIAVGKSDYKRMIQEGFERKKTDFIPGFIAPVEKETIIPQYIDNFLEKYPIIITGNASNNNHYNDQDLYGIDLFVEMMAELKADPTIGGIFFLARVSDPDYYNQILEQIQKYQLQDRLLLVEEQLEYYHILKRSTLFVRPTNTDGDAISLREALYYGLRSVASDAVERPEGTITFRNRDVGDLIAKVKKTLDKPALTSYGVDYYYAIVNKYKELVPTKRL